MPRATARHILVSTEAKAQSLKAEIDAGADFAQVAQGCGMRGRRIRTPAEVGEALDELLAAEGPALLDAVVDPDEPMLPPVRREDYVRKLQAALDAGTSGRGQIEAALREEPARSSLLD